MCFFLCVFFSDKNTFCLLTNGFQLFLKFLCVSPTSFSYFFLMWGQFDVYWYISEARGFCPFMPVFIVGEGQMSGGVLHSHSVGGGGQGGPFSLLPPLFSFFTAPFSLLPPLVSFLPPLLFSFLPATFSFLPPPLSFLPSILSFLPPPLSFLPPPFSPAPSTLSAPTFGYGTVRTKTSSSWDDSHKCKKSRIRSF